MSFRGKISFFRLGLMVALLASAVSFADYSNDQEVELVEAFTLVNSELDRFYEAAKLFEAPVIAEMIRESSLRLSEDKFDALIEQVNAVDYVDLGPKVNTYLMTVPASWKMQKRGTNVLLQNDLFNLVPNLKTTSQITAEAKLNGPWKRWSGQNGYCYQRDAFRHMYWSALLTKYYGPGVALFFSTSRELIYSTDSDSYAFAASTVGYMDIINNLIGIKLGLKNKDLKNSEIRSEIADLIDSGGGVMIDPGEIDSNPNLRKLVPTMNSEAFESTEVYKNKHKCDKWKPKENT